MARKQGSHFAIEHSHDVTEISLDLSRASHESGRSDTYEEPKARLPIWLEYIMLLPNPWNRIGEIAVCFVALLLVWTALVFGVVGVSSIFAGVHAAQAFSAVNTVTKAVKTGDADAIRKAMLSIRDDANAIKGITSNFMWDHAASYPLIGKDFACVQTLADVMADIGEDALVPLSEHAEAFNLSAIMADGRFDIDTIKDISAALEEVSPVLQSDIAVIEELEPLRHSPLGAIIGKVQEKAEPAGTVLAAFDKMDLPTLLGADGHRRSYLVIAQSNAELRATGGFPGAWVTLNFQDGAMSLGEVKHYQQSRLTTFDWTEEERDTFPMVTMDDPGGQGFIPDFEVVAPRFKYVFDRVAEAEVDGVVVIDPVFLQRILALTGPIKARDGTKVTGKNAAKELMSRVYKRYTGNQIKKQDVFFADVAKRTFKALTRKLNRIDFGDLANMLSLSASDYHLQIWMVDEGEEDAMRMLGVSGALSKDPAKPVLGVFINDNTWAKIGWYLEVKTEIGARGTASDGATTYQVKTTFTNHITKDYAEKAPRYISGYNPNKKDKGDMILLPSFFAPAGGSITDMSISTGDTFGEHTLYGFDVWNGELHVGAEESITATYTVKVAPGAEESLVVRMTPLARTY